jgi:hypothetical protein
MGKYVLFDNLFGIGNHEFNGFQNVDNEASNSFH